MQHCAADADDGPHAHDAPLLALRNAEVGLRSGATRLGDAVVGRNSRWGIQRRCGATSTQSGRERWRPEKRIGVDTKLRPLIDRGIVVK